MQDSGRHVKSHQTKRMGCEPGQQALVLMLLTFFQKNSDLGWRGRAARAEQRKEGCGDKLEPSEEKKELGQQVGGDLTLCWASRSVGMYPRGPVSQILSNIQPFQFHAQHTNPWL